jgi:hypothetical protein
MEENRKFTCIRMSFNQEQALAGHQWLTSIILATQEVEIRKTVV